MDDLQAGALNAWTPVQQAALYHEYMARQADEDDKRWLKEYEEEERKKQKKEIEPDSVKAGKIIDDLIKDRCPPLFQFLDIFGRPHIALVVFIALHLAFWLVTPWYLLHLLPYPMLYLIPIVCTCKAIYSKDDRNLWLSWWVELAIVEYLELLLFRGSVRSLVWWPKIKAFIFVLLYSVITKEDILSSSGSKKGEKPVFGAIKLITPWLPDVSASEDDKKKELDKERRREKEKAREKEKLHERQGKGKDGEKGKGKEKDGEKRKDEETEKKDQKEDSKRRSK